MSSRTPIRLTPHRGPLATPSASPESSPTSSTPPSDISHYSTVIKSDLDISVYQHRISTLSVPVRSQPWFLLYCWTRGVSEQGLFGRGPDPRPFSLVFNSLIYLAVDFANSLARMVTFCLLVFGILEWASHASESPGQQTPSISLLKFPLPTPTRALRCHVDPLLCEPKDEHVAVLQFLSEQVQHAKALSSLSSGLGLPLRAFLEAHRATIPEAIVRRNFAGLPHPVEGVDPLANLTDLLDPSFIDFTSGSFVGRSLALALEELGDLMSGPMALHGHSTPGDHQDAHLHAIYWRTTSNLLLEYSAARPRARRLLQDLHALHRQLSLLALGHHTTQSDQEKLNIWWWKSGLHYPATSAEDGIQAFVTGLEITLDNVHRLTAYLDWVTEQLAQTTLKDVLKVRHSTDFSSCMASLQQLFTQSKPSTPKRFCFCLDNHDVASIQPRRVEVIVPGSPTVRAGH